MYHGLLKNEVIVLSGVAPGHMDSATFGVLSADKLVARAKQEN